MCVYVVVCFGGRGGRGADSFVDLVYVLVVGVSGGGGGRGHVCMCLGVTWLYLHVKGMFAGDCVCPVLAPGCTCV